MTPVTAWQARQCQVFFQSWLQRAAGRQGAMRLPYVCARAQMRTHMHHHVGTSTAPRACTQHMYVCMYECMYVCMYVCTYVRMYVRIYICMYVCMYVCMYITCIIIILNFFSHAHAQTHTHIHTHTHDMIGYACNNVF